MNDLERALIELRASFDALTTAIRERESKTEGRYEAFVDEIRALANLNAAIRR